MTALPGPQRYKNNTRRLQSLHIYNYVNVVDMDIIEEQEDQLWRL